MDNIFEGLKYFLASILVIVGVYVLFRTVSKAIFKSYFEERSLHNMINFFMNKTKDKKEELK